MIIRRSVVSHAASVPHVYLSPFFSPKSAKRRLAPRPQASAGRVRDVLRLPLAARASAGPGLRPRPLLGTCRKTRSLACPVCAPHLRPRRHRLEHSAWSPGRLPSWLGPPRRHAGDWRLEQRNGSGSGRWESEVQVPRPLPPEASAGPETAGFSPSPPVVVPRARASPRLLLRDAVLLDALMSSFYPSHPFKGPLSRYGHARVLRGAKTSTHRSGGGGHSSARHTHPSPAAQQQPLPSKCGSPSLGPPSPPPSPHSPWPVRSRGGAPHPPPGAHPSGISGSTRRKLLRADPVSISVGFLGINPRVL